MTQTKIYGGEADRVLIERKGNDVIVSEEGKEKRLTCGNRQLAVTLFDRFDERQARVVLRCD